MPKLIIDMTEGMMAEIEDIAEDIGIWDNAYEYIEEAISEHNKKYLKGTRYHQKRVPVPKGIRIDEDEMKAIISDLHELKGYLIKEGMEIASEKVEERENHLMRCMNG